MSRSLPSAPRPAPKSSLSRVASAALAVIALALPGCDDGEGPDEGDRQVAPPETAAAVVPVASAALAVGAGSKQPFAPSRAGCETIEVFARGASAGSVCQEDVASQGLTTIDLSDAWTPRVFAVDGATGKVPDYRAKFLQLARSDTADLGLYGIAPTLSVLAGRLTDEERRACDGAIDGAPVAQLLTTWASAPDDRSRDAVLKAPDHRPAMRALQGQLACAGLLKKASANGVVGSSTRYALDAFRRRHLIVGAGLDGETLEALSLGGDELAFRGLLRGLRERVADAAGLLEDGSASGEHALVAGRALDLSRFAPPGLPALEHAAPDLVDAATDEAARALGWTSPDEARAFLAARGDDALQALHVAVALPAAPAYHSAAMELRVEIDRGDVFYDSPGRAAAARKSLGEVRVPSLVLYARDGEVDRPLIRWSTTIGGWKKERTEEGEIALKYKESDVGDRVWRQVIAAPAWMPPDSTPELDLLREGKDGAFSLKSDLIQPGHRNAYGLAMLIHEEVETRDDGTTRLLDRGIRTHGSVDYRSISRGTSHGCHRLYNQLVLRLTGYLLQHRAHTTRGKMRVGYHRTLTWEDQTVEVDVPHRGHLYELDPPVPVRVLPGRIAGEAQKPVSSLIRLPQEPSRG